MGKTIRYFQAMRVSPIPGHAATLAQIHHVLTIDDVVVVHYADGTTEYEWSDRMDQIGLRIAGLESDLPKATEALDIRWRNLPEPSKEFLDFIRIYLRARDQLSTMKLEVMGLFPTLSQNEVELIVAAQEEESD